MVVWDVFRGVDVEHGRRSFGSKRTDPLDFSDHPEEEVAMVSLQKVDVEGNMPHGSKPKVIYSIYTCIYL